MNQNEDGATGPAQPETVVVETVEAMMTLLGRWHRNKMARLSHLMLVPEGAEFEILDRDTQQVKTIKLTGELREAFKLGLQFAKVEFKQLPFVAEMEDPAPPAGDSPSGQPG